MKKWIEIMAALIVAFVLAGSMMVGCGQAAPDQGAVDTTDNSEADEKGEGEANPKGGGKGGGKGSGDDDPGGGTGGAGDPDNVNP